MEPLEVVVLPLEIIIEILSWLPVESLLRFKCVRKQWCVLISEDNKFIAKHMVRASSVTIPMIDKVLVYSRSAGLLLENNQTTEACRIRNPATKQVLDLPHARQLVRQMTLFFNSFTGECKVVWVPKGAVCIKIMTVGKDDKWRSLEIPDQNLLEHGKEVEVQEFDRTHRIGGVLYVPRIMSDGHGLYLEVRSLDPWSECFTTSTTLPRGLFLDLYRVMTFSWDNRLAVADIADGSLNILVLEDMKELKWSRNKTIVPLKFLKDDPLWEHRKIGMVTLMHSDEIHIQSRKDHFWYDMKTEEINKFVCLSKDERSTRSWPTLVTLKGMRPERDTTWAEQRS